MPLLIVIAGIIVLMVFILVFKLNSFLSFVITSLLVGLALGMPVEKVISSVETGIGNTLGFIVIIIGFGAMLGKLVAESGAAQKITLRLIKLFGLKRIQLAAMLTGFIIGVPMFYDVGFVILIPLVFRYPVDLDSDGDLYWCERIDRRVNSECSDKIVSSYSWTRFFMKDIRF